MSTHPARLLQRHETPLRRACLLAGLVPALWLGWIAHRGLEVNLLEALERGTGQWAFNYLLLTLAITPLRRLLTWQMVRSHSAYGKRISDWNVLIRLRRQFGLYSFFYALLHAGVYLWLDAGLDGSQVSADLAEKPYVVAGAVGFLLLLPLAASTPKAAVRRLGRRWRPLHRLTYLVAVAGACHFVWLSKPGPLLPWVYAALVIVLLGYRVLAGLGVLFPRPGDDGMEVAPRPDASTLKSPARGPLSPKAVGFSPCKEDTCSAGSTT